MLIREVVGIGCQGNGEPPRLGVRDRRTWPLPSTAMSSWVGIRHVFVLYRPSVARS